MDSNLSASTNAHPLGVVTKDDVVIIGDTIVMIVAGEANLYPDGRLDGCYESRPVNPHNVFDLHDDGARVFEISEEFSGQWR